MTHNQNNRGKPKSTNRPSSVRANCAEIHLQTPTSYQWSDFPAHVEYLIGHHSESHNEATVESDNIQLPHNLPVPDVDSFHIIVLGNEGSGKSTFADRMESTILNSQCPIQVLVWDFADISIHETFFISQAIYVVVWHVKESFQQAVLPWMKLIQDRVAHPNILLIGTHCELASKDLTLNCVNVRQNTFKITFGRCAEYLLIDSSEHDSFTQMMKTVHQHLEAADLQRFTLVFADERSCDVCYKSSADHDDQLTRVCQDIYRVIDTNNLLSKAHPVATKSLSTFRNKVALPFCSAEDLKEEGKGMLPLWHAHGEVFVIEKFVIVKPAWLRAALHYLTHSTLAEQIADIKKDLSKTDQNKMMELFGGSSEYLRHGIVGEALMNHLLLRFCSQGTAQISEIKEMMQFLNVIVSICLQTDHSEVASQNYLVPALMPLMPADYRHSPYACVSCTRLERRVTLPVFVPPVLIARVIASVCSRSAGRGIKIPLVNATTLDCCKTCCGLFDPNSGVSITLCQENCCRDDCADSFKSNNTPSPRCHLFCNSNTAGRKRTSTIDNTHQLDRWSHIVVTSTGPAYELLNHLAWLDHCCDAIKLALVQLPGLSKAPSPDVVVVCPECLSRQRTHAQCGLILQSELIQSICNQLTPSSKDTYFVGITEEDLPLYAITCPEHDCEIRLSSIINLENFKISTECDPNDIKFPLTIRDNALGHGLSVTCCGTATACFDHHVNESTQVVTVDYMAEKIPNVSAVLVKMNEACDLVTALVFAPGLERVTSWVVTIGAHCYLAREICRDFAFAVVRLTRHVRRRSDGVLEANISTDTRWKAVIGQAALSVAHAGMGSYMTVEDLCTVHMGCELGTVVDYHARCNFVYSLPDDVTAFTADELDEQIARIVLCSPGRVQDEGLLGAVVVVTTEDGVRQIGGIIITLSSSQSYVVRSPLGCIRKAIICGLV